MRETVETAQKALAQVIELEKSERIINELYKARTAPGLSEIDFNQETVDSVERIIIDIANSDYTTAEKLERADELLAAFPDVELRDGRAILKAFGKA